MASKESVVQDNRVDFRKRLRLLLHLYDLQRPKINKTSKEKVNNQENVKWLSSSANDLQVLTQQLLESWVKFGERKFTIEDETKFCESEMLQQVLEAKSSLQPFQQHQIRAARNKCNPFEKVKSSIFQNRSAVKIAELDASLNFMFTNPTDENGKPLTPDLLYFADVCSGPGGFSEYVLWRKNWMAKGFGFTLKDDFDLNLNTFTAAKTETFQIFYGVKGDGDITDPENIVSLNNYIRNQTKGKGVHFMMGDGGIFVSDRDKNRQEILCRQLYLCQCLAALFVVREGGNFIVKLFDVFTLFSAGLVYLMYKCFKQITVVKPSASRPGSSERYLIGKFKKPNTQTITVHLFNVSRHIWDNRHRFDCIEIVPYEVIKEDRQFFAYLCDSNNSIGRNQVVYLREIAAICTNSQSVPLDVKSQQKNRLQCLKAWKLPKKREKKANVMSLDERFKKIIGEWYHIKQFMLSPDRKLSDVFDLRRVLHTQSDYFFVPIDTFEKEAHFIRSFFMSLGGYDVYYYTSSGEWKQLENVAIEISDETLIYGDIVPELNIDKTSTVALHIIDGLVLGGVDIRHLPLQERLEMCHRFANSLNKPVKLVEIAGKAILTSPISCKKLYPIKDLQKFFDQLSRCTQKDGTKRLGLKVENFLQIERRYVPGALLFLNEVKPSLVKAFFSNTCREPFYEDQATGAKFFAYELEDPKSIFSSFKTTFINRFFFKWKTIT